MIRGWCPGLYEPMPTGDGLLVRIKPPGGRLSSAAARALARAAARFGNGVIELTGRGNLQVRGLDAAGAPRFAAAMVAAGLASADPLVERRRNIMVSPLAGDDPTAAADTEALAAALDAMLAAEPALASLPGKFAFAVDGGGVLPLLDPADIVVRCITTTAMVGLDPTIHAAQAAPDAASVVRHVDAPKRRHRVDHRVKPDDDGWKAVAGERLATTVAQVRDLALAAGTRRLRDRNARAPSPTPVGFIAYPGTGHGAFGFGLPFGQTDTAALERLADLADRFGDGVLRLSPWRSVLLSGVQARDALPDLGLIVDPGDRRLRMAACIGAAGCASGTVRAREDAAALADAGWTGFLHVSGCAKGCAHQGGTPVTLVGDGGLYRLVRDGQPDVAGLSVRQVAACLA